MGVAFGRPFRPWRERMRRTIVALVTSLTAVLAAAVPARAQNPPVTVSVDVSADQRPIDPRIYGVNYGTPAGLQDLNATLNRQRGSPTTRYNWQANADNRADDFFFESLPVASGSATPAEWGDSFIAQTKAAGAEPMITVPI